MTDKKSLPISLQEFPHGSCGDAVLLLGHYLSKQGFGKFDYMLGDLDYEIGGYYPSHSWLQQKKLIVDITADQFDDFSDPVFVETHSPWHERFNGKVEHVADFFCFEETDTHTFYMLKNAFFNILKNIQ